MTTHTTRAAEIKREWHLVDAKDQILGRLATRVANLLTGKSKVIYAPYLDGGDYVVVINAERIVLTGKKTVNKKYFRHSGFPMGFKAESYREVVEKEPTKIFEHAVKGMLPKNRLTDQRMARLKIIMGAENPHQDKFKTETKTLKP